MTLRNLPREDFTTQATHSQMDEKGYKRDKAEQTKIILISEPNLKTPSKTRLKNPPSQHVR
jgi:hypothetical protein